MNAIEFYDKLKINYPSLYNVCIKRASGWIDLLSKTVFIFDDECLENFGLDINSYDSLYEFIVSHENEILLNLL